MKTQGTGLIGMAIVALLGCSPKADPIGKGQTVFVAEYPDSSIGTCGLPDQGGIGQPPPTFANADFTVDDLGGEVVDGQSDPNGGSYEVKCTVTSSGKLDIDIVGPNYMPDPSSRGTASVEVNGSLSTDDGTGTANVTVRTVLTGAMASQGNRTCTLTALEDSSGDPAVGAGSAAFVFVCPAAVTSQDQFGVCATRGVVIVRDCLEE